MRLVREALVNYLAVLILFCFISSFRLRPPYTCEVISWQLSGAAVVFNGLKLEVRVCAWL